MSSVSLAESAKLAQDELVAGVIESIVTLNPMFELLLFDALNGNALKYTREGAIGPVATVGVGDTDGVIGPGAPAGSNQAARLAAKDPATFVEVTASLTTIMGDAEINGLINSTRSSDGNDQTQTQIASKAKAAGRLYQDMMVNGDGTNETFPGMLALVAASQTVPAVGANGDALSFEVVDEVLDKVTDKDGEVDYLVMNERTIRSFKTLLRNQGGASIVETMELPSGTRVMTYGADVPIIRNNYIPTDQTTGASNTTTTFFAGTMDEGGRQHGIVGLTAERMAGISVVPVGESETKDEFIWRIKWYCGFALFSELGLAAATGITN